MFTEVEHSEEERGDLLTPPPSSEVPHPGLGESQQVTLKMTGTVWSPCKPVHLQSVPLPPNPWNSALSEDRLHWGSLVPLRQNRVPL